MRSDHEATTLRQHCGDRPAERQRSLRTSDAVELDENVDPSSSLQVVNALIQARKDFDRIVAPGLGHTALRSSGPVDYGLRRQYDFFLKHLAGVKTPDWNALIDATPPVH